MRDEDDFMAMPCTDPDATTLEKLAEAIEFSERNRVKVEELIHKEIPHTRRRLELRHRESSMDPPSDAEVTAIAEIAVGSDPKYTTAVSNERWGWRMATMYALQHLAETAYVQRELLEQVRILTATVNSAISLPRQPEDPPL